MSTLSVQQQVGRGNPSRADIVLDEIDQAHGYIDRATFSREELVVGGWMMHPAKTLDELRFYLNGTFVRAVEINERADVGQAFPWIAHASHSGFNVRFPLPNPDEMQHGRVDLVGYADGRPIARLGSLYRTDLDAAVPTPPPSLMHRVARTRDTAFFKTWGLKCVGDMLGYFRRHAAFDRTSKMLDWGCGCGRMTVHFLDDGTGPEVYGCDVDGEAIDWCNRNLQPGRFTKIEPFPPTPYADASFQLAAGYSVFTHLTKEVQLAWLTELRRILAPGAIFVATVHGDFASSLAFRGNVAPVQSTGLFDDVHDDVLDGIVPKGYYRGTFQTQDYTRREWGKYFDILEYGVRGIGNHQDVVVMRRPA